MCEPTAQIFNIVHGSFVDGYGIRTTVFLKGCPLRCLWCCNPEGQQCYAELKYVEEDCNGCGKCVAECPERAIVMGKNTQGESKAVIDRSKCTNCMKCIDYCCTNALDCFGKAYSVSELFDMVKNDVPFYRSMGGGVTIGGGEPTLMPEFTLAFIRKCHDNFISVAVDTCGYTTTTLGQKVLEEADLLLFDLKGMDDIQHVKDTGVSNEIILKNMRSLGSIGKPMIVRVPLIPGHNDSNEQIEALGQFLASINSVERVDIMNYHEYGISKYGQLGMKYLLTCEKHSTERVEEMKVILKKYVNNVQIGG